MEGLELLKDSFVGGINSIIDFFQELLSYINPFSENFILKPIIEMFITLLDYLNPLSENFFLKIAFIPQSEEYELKKQELIDSFKQKFLFYDNILDALEQIKNLGSGSASVPTFDVSLPEKYGGGTYSIVDFSMFSDYRIYVLNFTRCVMWFFFVKGIFRSLPKTTSLQG